MRSIHGLLLAVFLIIFSLSSFAQVGIAITFGPPALPVYEQPPCPAEGYIWTPGYWAYDYDYDDYYWVPGTWVLVPEPGFFWTPPYWAWNGASFVFYDGYWGPEVGFYGGINYGYGYFGNGFVGGRWEGRRFFYNRAVTNINVTNITNVYNTTVVNQTTVNRVSYNGGPGGITARPTRQEEAFARERHVGPVGAQTQQVQAARSDPQLRASQNEGRPPIAATPRPGEFRGSSVVRARAAGAPYHPPANRGARSGAPRGFENVPRPPNNARPVHPRDLSPLERPAARDTGNQNADRKYQREQDKLYSQQQREREKLQQRQEQEHQKLTRKNADQARQQQLEQRHEHQTEQLQQRQQERQQRTQGPPRGNERREPPK